MSVEARKRPEEGTHAGLTEYERSKAFETFRNFFHPVPPSPNEFFREISLSLTDPTVRVKKEEQRRNLINDMDVMLKDKELNRLLLEYLKIDIRVNKSSISNIVSNLSETKAYPNLAAKFRNEDHAELREAIAYRLRYDIMSFRPFHVPKDDTIVAKGANRIMDKFGVPTEADVPVEKRANLFGHKTVMEKHQLTVYERLDKFKKGEF